MKSAGCKASGRRWTRTWGRGSSSPGPPARAFVPLASRPGSGRKCDLGVVRSKTGRKLVVSDTTRTRRLAGTPPNAKTARSPRPASPPTFRSRHPRIRDMTPGSPGHGARCRPSANPLTPDVLPHFIEGETPCSVCVRVCVCVSAPHKQPLFAPASAAAAMRRRTGCPPRSSMILFRAAPRGGDWGDRRGHPPGQRCRTRSGQPMIPVPIAGTGALTGED